jgi:hypothetical protein
MRERVPADNEFLGFGDLVLDPGAAAPIAFVDGGFSLGDQSLQTKFLSDADKLVIAAAELVGKPDIVGRVLEKGGQLFAPGVEWLFAEIFLIQEKQIENVIYQRHVSRLLEKLQKLERRA